MILDGGYEAAHRVVRGLFGTIIEATDVDNWSKDPKTELQEWLQARKLPVPAYRIVATRGEKHAQTFEVECAVATLGLTETGEGRSRRTAEQEAAARMIETLKTSDGPEGPLRS
jgi:ribonuclease-3